MQGLRHLRSAAGLALAILGAAAAAASPASASVCTGSSENPGVLAGTYSSNVVIDGICRVNAGAAVVKGNLTVSANAGLVAAYALDDQTGKGSSSLTVDGSVKVETGASLIVGCEKEFFPCLDGKDLELSSRDKIGGNLTSKRALGVVVHQSTIGGSVKQTGGGGGDKCKVLGGAFVLADSEVFSAYEDSEIGGELRVTGLRSCWLGVARVHVERNVDLINDRLWEQNSIDILANTIKGNLDCQRNSGAWDSGDEGEESLYPRKPEPNTVEGRRMGQCVLASPETEGGQPGPGPF